MKNFQSLSFVSQSLQPEPDIWYFYIKNTFLEKIFHGQTYWTEELLSPPEWKLRCEIHIYN